MKNRKWALLCAAALIVLTACGKAENEPKEMPTESSTSSVSTEAETSTPADTSEAKDINYEEIVATFQATTFAEANEKMNAGDEFFLYIGREDCPACKKFVPLLKKIREEKGFDVLYVDANVEDPDFPEMIAKYRLEYIPILMKSSGKSFTKLEYGERVTEESVRGMFQ